MAQALLSLSLFGRRVNSLVRRSNFKDISGADDNSRVCKNTGENSERAPYFTHLFSICFLIR